MFWEPDVTPRNKDAGVKKHDGGCGFVSAYMHRTFLSLGVGVID